MVLNNKINMRPNVWYFVKTISKIFKINEPILEIGSLQVQGQESISNLRVFFNGMKYIGCDISEGPGVDIVMDVHNLSFQDNSIGTIIIVETLEHIENPIRVMEEIYRVLKNEGLVVMTSSMNFGIHNYPSDYWRFTPQGFLLLLKKFNAKIVGFQGNPLNPHSVFGIGIKNSSIDIETFQRFCNIFVSELSKSTHTFDENLFFNYYINGELKSHFVKKHIIGKIKAVRNKLYLYICKIYNLYIMHNQTFRKLFKKVYQFLRIKNILPPYDR